MNTQLQQLWTEGWMDDMEYRAYTLFTVMAKLVMALILGILMLSSYLVI